MSVASPARSLVGRCISSSRTATSPSSAALSQSACHQFHTSAPRSKRHSRFRNVKAEELGLLKPHNMAKYQKEQFPEYTTEELTKLKKKYTPEQLEALKAGEAAVDPKDIIIQGRLRDDMFRPEYLEDYSKRNPRLDLKPEIEGKPEEPKWLEEEEFEDDYLEKMTNMMKTSTGNQLTRAMVRALLKVKKSEGAEMIDLTEEELLELERNPETAEKFLVKPGEREKDGKLPDEETLTREKALHLDSLVDKAWKAELDKLSASSYSSELRPNSLELIQDGPEGAMQAHSAVQYDLGKIPGVDGLYKRSNDDDEMDAEGQYTEVKQQTGWNIKMIQSIYTKTLVTRFVHNQTRLGKIRSISIVAIAGNGDGRLGLGIAKSTEASVAESTAKMLAIRNMKPIRRYENRTVYGNIQSKISGTIVEVSSRPPGFGLRVPSRFFEMCRAAGIHDLSARMPRSKNPMNSVKCMYDALMNQPDPEEIAMGRGKKLVDARKVYYGGAVY